MTAERTDTLGGWEIERWISEDAVAGVEYSGYWNDEQTELDKPFNVLDDDFGKLEHYLDQVGLPADLSVCLDALNAPLRGCGIDLAAGTLWAAPLLLRAGPVERLYCLEYSKHRLLTLGPRVLEHYTVSPQRVVLVYGSFYDLQLDDESLDFAFLSQAFHHADRPGALLGELRRVLKPGGVVLILGEHILRARHYALYAARAGAAMALPRSVQRRLLAREIDMRFSLRPRGRDIIPNDPTLGDHSYTRHEFGALFSEAGFSWRHIRRHGSHYQSFVLERLS